jgi:hypothetical protein
MAKPSNINIAPGGGGGAPRAVRTVKISPNVTIKAPKGGPGFTPKEVTRLKSITEVTKPTSKATAKVNAKALKASGVVKPKTDTKTNNYTFPKNSLEIKESPSTARADARAAVAARKAAAQKRAEAIERTNYLRGNY